jgi:phosphoglycerate dehydrogenase-like enzyme
MEVLAYTRSPKDTPESRKDHSYIVPNTGDPDGLIPSRWFHGSTTESLNAFLRQGLDLLVICLPLSTETRGMLDTEQFRILAQRRTFVCNVGRGPLIVNSALIEALEAVWLRGAALDVTDPEPLPEGDPLWSAPRLLITPHVSWKSDKYWDRVLDILVSNVKALDRGEKMVNAVR